MDILFIGGPKDGLRMAKEETGGEYYIEFPVVTSFDPAKGFDQPLTNATFRRARYRVLRMSCGEEVFVYSEMTPDDAMRELIRRYPVQSKGWRS